MPSTFKPPQMLNQSTVVLEGGVFQRLWFRLIGALVASAGIQFVTSFEGDPNGIVSAAPGTLGVSRTAGANTTLWVREDAGDPSAWVAK